METDLIMRYSYALHETDHLILHRDVYEHRNGHPSCSGITYIG